MQLRTLQPRKRLVVIIHLRTCQALERMLALILSLLGKR